MKNNYSDIIALTDKTPIWYDENGCPRFLPHTPNFCPCVYANEVVLLKIKCQDCEKEFDVQMSSWLLGRKSFRVRIWQYQKDEIAKFTPIHYGDPPAHDCIGDTMNCEDLAIIEFWSKDNKSEWERITSCEIKFV